MSRTLPRPCSLSPVKSVSTTAIGPPFPRPPENTIHALPDASASPLRISFVAGGKVRRSVNERRRCNLRFATRTSGAINARTEGDTAREREEHRVGGHVKPDVGDVGGLRPAEHATVPAADVGGRGRRPLGARPV